VLGDEGIPGVPYYLVGSPEIGDAFHLRRRGPCPSRSGLAHLTP
jgi:hypothetical protein